MNSIKIRKANLKDIPFLTKTIIEAEKSGTTILSYSAIFGLNEFEIEMLISKMLSEEIEDCELSISSFLIAEENGITAASLSGWLENASGIPSAVLKGNLLNYFLPRESFEKAAACAKYTKELHIDYVPNSFQIGAGYVAESFRGRQLLGLLTEELINRLTTQYPSANEIYAQIFDCNIPSLKTYQRAGFEIINTKISKEKKITDYLPSSKKILLKKNLGSFYEKK